MQEIKNAVLDGEWVVCANCGHKLGRAVGDKPPTGIEIKCHSCKEINIVDKCKQWKEPKPKKVVQYKVPHCIHCVEYKEFTGVCLARLRAFGLGTLSQCKPVGSRTCKSFEPKEEFKDNYKEYMEERKNDI